MSEFFHQTANLLYRVRNRESASAVILAAGNSTRMGAGKSKQFLEINGIPVLAYTLTAYQNCKLIDEIVVVAKAEDIPQVRLLCRKYRIDKLRTVITGGTTRQESAEKGFHAIDPKAHYIAIADGARCLVTSAQITDVCLRAFRFQAASAAHLIGDTVKRTNASDMVTETIDRKHLWQVQTPQIFHTALYTAALFQAQRDHFTATDDNMLIEHLGYRVKLVECGAENMKITTPDDLSVAKAILSYRSSK